MQMVSFDEQGMPGVGVKLDDYEVDKKIVRGRKKEGRKERGINVNTNKKKNGEQSQGNGDGDVVTTQTDELACLHAACISLDTPCCDDYDTSFSRVYFSRPGFFRHPLLPFRPFFSPVVARSFSLSRLSFDLLPGAGSCSLHAPPKSKICPLWLILPYQTPGTENSQTVTQKIHKQNTQ
ncbi:hypothetical protein TNCV_2715981 [Trichonephila clavipes]|nr:hypothetical protein TNCV_2715981 [Trichonephila clavipes]